MQSIKKISSIFLGTILSISTIKSEFKEIIILKKNNTYSVILISKNPLAVTDEIKKNINNLISKCKNLKNQTIIKKLLTSYPFDIDLIRKEKNLEKNDGWIIHEKYKITSNNEIQDTSGIYLKLQKNYIFRKITESVYSTYKWLTEKLNYFKTNRKTRKKFKSI